MSRMILLGSALPALPARADVRVGYIDSSRIWIEFKDAREAQDRFEREYPPEALGPATEDYRVAAPVSLAFDIFKDKQQFRLAGRVKTTLELPCSRQLGHRAQRVACLREVLTC